MLPHASPSQPNPSQERVAALARQYRSAIEASNLPYLEEARFEQLITYFADEWDLDLALKTCEAAAEQHPFQGLFPWRKAQILCHLKAYEPALEAIEQALILRGWEAELFYTKLEILYHLGEHQICLEALKTLKLSRQAPLWPAFQLLKASIFEAKNEYEQALASLALVLNSQPNCEAVYARIWRYVEMQCLDFEVLELLEQVLEENPYAAQAWFELGHLYQHFKQYREAVKAYDYAIITKPDFEFAYRHCVAALFELRDYEKAYCYLEEYLQYFQADTEILVQMGRCFEYREQYDKALALYEQALKLSTDKSYVFYQMGLCQIYARRSEEALAYFQAAKAENPHNPDFYMALGEAYKTLDRPESVHHYYKKALALEPRKSEIWLGYFEFLIDEYLFDQAHDLLEQAQKFCQDTELDLAKVAVLLLEHQTQEGLLRLGQILEEQANAANKLFDLAPHLEKDPKIKAFLQTWQQAKQRGQGSF